MFENGEGPTFFNEFSTFRKVKSRRTKYDPPHYRTFYPTSWNQGGKSIYQLFHIQVTVLTVLDMIELK